MPPAGIHGGETGAPVDGYVIGADGTGHRFDSRVRLADILYQGDTVILQSAAGGYGDPLARDPQTFGVTCKTTSSRKP